MFLKKCYCELNDNCVHLLAETVKIELQCTEWTIKKHFFFTFYGTQIFLTVGLTHKRPPLEPVLSHSESSLHNHTLLLKLHFIIT